VEALLAHQLDKFEMIVQAGVGCTAATMLILCVCSPLVCCIQCDPPRDYLSVGILLFRFVSFCIISSRFILFFIFSH
jgi:hypothetical protein